MAKTKQRRKSKIKRLGNMPARSATERRDEAIANAYARGVHREDLAEKYDLSVNTVSAIVWRAGGRGLRG